MSVIEQKHIYVHHTSAEKPSEMAATLRFRRRRITASSSCSYAYLSQQAAESLTRAFVSAHVHSFISVFLSFTLLFFFNSCPNPSTPQPLHHPLTPTLRGQLACWNPNQNNGLSACNRLLCLHNPYAWDLSFVSTSVLAVLISVCLSGDFLDVLACQHKPRLSMLRGDYLI